MPDIEYIRSEIERMRMQVYRQRGEIRQLQRAGISTTSAEALLDRMLNNIDGLCAERDRLKKEQPRPSDVRYIRNHPKHDRFPVRRLGLAALLIAVAMILLVVLPSPWPI
jgi:hypothetical protein